MGLGAASALELVDSAVGFHPRLAHERVFSETSLKGRARTAPGAQP
jgi:hypothetical protein